MREQLLRRFAYLYSGECFSLFSFAILSYLVHIAFSELQLYSLLSFWSSFFLLEFILVQGTLYWYSKWKRLKKGKDARAPMHVLKRLKAVEKLNIALILFSPIGMMIDILYKYPDLPVNGLVLTAGIYLFGILEYINYFHIQLSYDQRTDLKYLFKWKRFKKACLKKEFENMGSRGKGA
ncbi:general stress protein [Cytobacillus spongiae]|uniref:general stress protein n=1 Tax=Cytobacillus spongiae TaxID=2901381 RepID=UPI001F3554E6|nr:general stress protein [Cytobacillus spongiae]UII56606.1 general stress protein [Cytobacillus spongiae]